MLLTFGSFVHEGGAGITQQNHIVCPPASRGRSHQDDAGSCCCADRVRELLKCGIGGFAGLFCSSSHAFIGIATASLRVDSEPSEKD